MLTVWQILFHFLWILGASVALAALSWRWFRRPQPSPWSQPAINLGGILFCLGQAGIAGVTWQGGLWMVLAIALGALMLLDIRALR